MVDLQTLRRRTLDDGESEDRDEPEGRSRIFSMCSQLQMLAPRLVDRQGTFYHQSMGRMKIRRINHGRSTWQLHKADPFHSLVNMSTAKLLGLVFCVIVASWIVFGVLFLTVSRSCDLGADNFVKALYLAIETIETIGYGVKDPTFHGCYSGFIVLGACALWESVLNAVFISIIYTRVSRAQSRASSICFSEKAVVVQYGGAWYLMLQICDFRKHQLCEAHVRLYSVQHAEGCGGVCFQTRAMRLQHPDDELGGMLLLALPQVVVHRIDQWSPLCPPAYRCCDAGTPASSFRYPDILQRAADAENGSREAGPAAARPEAMSADAIARHLAGVQLEVLCLVEGIDPSSSSTLQARHSYTCDDIVYNALFNHCVSRAPDGSCEVNFGAFHELVDPARLSGGMGVQSMP